MTDQPAVEYERVGRVGKITLNRPDNRNSMTAELLASFVTAIAEARADEELRCLVITGKGRCFSAGADFKSQIQADDPSRLPHEKSFAMYEPFLGVLDIEVPVIGALNGHAVGGGFGLSLMCDLRIAKRDAKYGANFTRLGLSPGMAISYLLPRLVGVPRANELLFTGRLMLGDEAARIGLVNEAVEGDSVLPRSLELAETIAENAPLAMRMTKRGIYSGLNWAIKEAAFEEAYAQAFSLQTADAKEGMGALLEKREPQFTGT
jgi:enoyl-CoA hydratase/carnithine racemase